MVGYPSRIDAQFKYYTFITVIYAMLMITAQAVAYRLIQIGPFLEPGGIFIFPASFAVGDILSEVYGPTLARRSIIFSLCAQAFYSILPPIVNSLPYPADWVHLDAYKVVFGSSWLVFCSNLAAVLVGMVFNVQLIAKTKFLVAGKYFSVRSFISSAIGELILTAIIVSVALAPVVGIAMGAKLFINMFLFKTLFSLAVIFPASLVVVFLKRHDNVDIYEENILLNPLRALFVRSPQRAGVNVIRFSESKGRIKNGI